MEKIYTCAEIADRYGVKLITVQDWVRRKKLGAMKIGKAYRIAESDIATFEKAGRSPSTDGDGCAS